MPKKSSKSAPKTPRISKIKPTYTPTAPPITNLNPLQQPQTGRRNVVRAKEQRQKFGLS